MNENKLCFITCTNDEEMYEETKVYINSLYTPEGFVIETISVKDAPYITKAYNEAAKNTDAKYKIYLHQDVFIINQNFISDILAIFHEFSEVGMIGVAGAKDLPASGVWWEAQEKYGKVYDSHTGNMQLINFMDFNHKYQEVDCIDGLLMATQYDVPWREDIFTGWHFYDLSQSMEFKKAQYKVVVPFQEKPWCIHDSGIANIANGFEYYRKIFSNEYM